MTESLMLSTAGWVIGVVLAYCGTSVLVRIIARGRENIELQVRPDSAVLLFTALVALLSGILFGLAPAWQACGAAPALRLREAGRAGETRIRGLFGRALVAAQVAFSVVLLSAACLFVRHLADLGRIAIPFVPPVTVDFPVGAGQ